MSSMTPDWPAPFCGACGKQFDTGYACQACGHNVKEVNAEIETLRTRNAELEDERDRANRDCVYADQAREKAEARCRELERTLRDIDEGLLQYVVGIPHLDTAAKMHRYRISILLSAAPQPEKEGDDG